MTKAIPLFRHIVCTVSSSSTTLCPLNMAEIERNQPTQPNRPADRSISQKTNKQLQWLPLTFTRFLCLHNTYTTMHINSEYQNTSLLLPVLENDRKLVNAKCQQVLLINHKLCTDTGVNTCTLAAKTRRHGSRPSSSFAFDLAATLDKNYT